MSAIAKNSVAFARHTPFGQHNLARLRFCRFASSCSAVVAGSGPAGLAVVGNLLEQNVQEKIIWVDPFLQGGKLNGKWREVPSNTKVNLFIGYAKALETFKNVIENTPKPNAITALEGLEQEKGCQISYAADMCLMLQRGLLEHPKIRSHHGIVTGADWNPSKNSWTVEMGSTESNEVKSVSSQRLVLCTGSTPNAVPIPVPGIDIQRVGLETALTPSILRMSLPNETPSTIAVVGSSHSAILVLMNLYELATSTHPHLRIKWFTRTELRYAEYKDGWILRDNTGLKGKAADFARENLEDQKLPLSNVGKFIQRFDCSQNEQKKYEATLPECSHIIHATGFLNNPLPTLTMSGRPFGKVEFDHNTGAFIGPEGKQVPGLFGAGIAFPERVKDPLGNIEFNVGLFKFMKFLKRVAGEWVGSSRPSRRQLAV